ncbi:MAG: DUF4230 domain-containing protein, partial [Bacteroidia bacterium]|nr:DUF4230 domain-containing protein [Bacteroidia bacterium]
VATKFWSQLRKNISAFRHLSITPYLVVIVLTLIIAWFLFRPKEDSTKITETNDMAVTKIQAIGRIELVKLTIKDVLEYNIERDYLPDSKVLLVVSGEMAGCIDLAKIRKDQISVKDSVVRIVLPKPEMCYYKIDQQKTRIYNATTYFLLDNEALITQLAYRRAENYFRSDSLNQIVYKETEANVQTMLRPLLESITQKRVELEFDKRAIKP